MPLVEVAQIGAWWTYDAPTLRVPGRAGRYLSVWSVGAGMSLLAVPPADADHTFWHPWLAELAQRFIVHAMDRSAPRSGGQLADDVETVLDATGAKFIVAPADASAELAEVAARRDILLATFEPARGVESVLTVLEGKL